MRSQQGGQWIRDHDIEARANVLDCPDRADHGVVGHNYAARDVYGAGWEAPYL